MAPALHNNAIRAQIDYTTKDAKHEYEKPYDIRYDTGGVVPKTNTTSDTHTVLVRDFRPMVNASNFEDYGFSVEKIGLGMTADIFNEDANGMRRTHYPVVEKALWGKFPGAAGVYIIDHNVRCVPCPDVVHS